MIPSVTVSFSCPADRLAELQRFCLEELETETEVVWAQAPAEKVEEALDGLKKPRRGRPKGSRNKAKAEADAEPEPQAAPEAPPAVEPPQPEAPPTATLDGLRVAVRKAVIAGPEGLQKVEAALRAVGADAVGAVPADKIAEVIAAIGGGS